MGVIRADIYNPPYSLESKYFLKRTMFTHIIYLDRDEYKIPDKKIEEHLRTGDRRGALVTEFNDKNELDRFYDLVVKTYRRHNRPPRYSREFFAELFDLAQRDDRVRWLAVRLKERLIGTRIYFRDKDTILLWQYYSDYEYQQYKPGYLLIDHIIKYALDHGVRSINMGGSPEEAAGLIDHKERWGGVKTDLPYYTLFGGLGKLLYRRER
jgi:predicted N-acyltransferase